MKKRYESESRLIEKVQTGEYGWKEYISNHSKDLNDEYENFCKFRGLDPNDEESAEKFMELREKELEEAFETANV